EIDRRRRRAWCRSQGCSAGSLEPRPQSDFSWRNPARLQPRPSSRLAPSAKGRRMNTRIFVLGTILGGVVLTSVPAAIGWAPVLIWNASASVAIGLYLVQPADHLAVADLVVVTPPEQVARFLAERDYL